MQVPATWQGIPGQPQLPTTAQQMAAPGATLQQPGLVFPIQQFQVTIPRSLRMPLQCRVCAESEWSLEHVSIQIPLS